MSDISIVSNLQIMRLETRKSVPEHASIYQSQQYKPAWFFKVYIYILIIQQLQWGMGDLNPGRLR